MGDTGAAALLDLAREAIVRWVRGQEPPPLPELEGSPRCGAFVSLHRGGELRGCIGQLETDAPLPEVVRRMAVAAARDDPRFAPVAPDELADLEVEVSVLSPLARARAEDVVPGRDGVVVRHAGRQGVLLPQVAPEQGWDRDTLLSHACRKAGLPPLAWRDSRTELLTFRAQVIGADRR